MKRTRILMTTDIPKPDIHLGDWFRVVRVTTDEEETVFELVRQSPSATPSSESKESGSSDHPRPRKAGERSR